MTRRPDPLSSSFPSRLLLRRRLRRRPAGPARRLGALLGAWACAVVWPAAAPAGNLTSADEIAVMRGYAQQGIAPYAEGRRSVASQAAREWRWGSVSGRYVTTRSGGAKRCHPEADAERVAYLKEGAPDAYAKAIAYHFADQPDAALAEEARQRVLDLVDTTGFHGLSGEDWSADNQCILELGISIPVWIETALLLESTPVWTEDDRAAFSAWLASEVYPRVAWASRVRRNNWGAAGSLAASLVARYVAPRVAELREIEPSPRRLAPPVAAREHDEQQLARIHTAWSGDSRCSRFGIQDHGGIPDELRRGAGGCEATSLPSERDPSHSYQTMHVELLVFHAEALRRAGDPGLFRARTGAGRPALLQAILFVIDNPSPEGRSFAWGTRKGALAVAFRSYGDDRLLRAVEAVETFRGGRTLPYAALAPDLGPRSQLPGAPGAPRVSAPATGSGRLSR